MKTSQLIKTLNLRYNEHQLAALSLQVAKLMEIAESGENKGIYLLEYSNHIKITLTPSAYDMPRHTHILDYFEGDWSMKEIFDIKEVKETFYVDLQGKTHKMRIKAATDVCDGCYFLKEGNCGKLSLAYGFCENLIFVKI